MATRFTILISMYIMLDYYVGHDEINVTLYVNYTSIKR